MARLTTKGRKRIKRSNFALPAQRRYPIHDRVHARNALARVAQHGSASERRRVKAAVARKYPSIGGGKTTTRKRRSRSRSRRQ